MKIAIAKPPCWDEANKLFQLDKLKKGTVFTYGDVIYNPDNLPMSDHLIAHEEEHGRQQQHDEHVASLWWKRVIADPAFRIDQEARAYGVQYAFICKRVKDRNKRVTYLLEMARMLAGEMYGNCVSQQEAMRLIRLHSKV